MKNTEGRQRWQLDAAVELAAMPSLSLSMLAPGESQKPGWLGRGL